MPPGEQARFERAAASCAPELFRQCPAFLRHKELLLSPALLKSLGVPFSRVTQKAREFVVTSPGAYHAGFNHGYNCAESTNFATRAWVPFGAVAKECECCEGGVSIDMSLFGVKPSAKRGRYDDESDEQEEEEEPRRVAGGT